MTNQVSEFGTVSEFPSIFSGDKLKKNLMAWLTGFIKWYVEATLSFDLSWDGQMILYGWGPVEKLATDYKCFN